jgi:hypothetical protein
MQKLAADAAVETDAAGDVLDVRADPLAQIGDLVDKGDLVARKALAAYLINSAVSMSVNSIGVSIR